jgi:hypothetical protein
LQIEAGVADILDFGSLDHVFVATDGNVHFDGHLSFVTVDGLFVLVCYQVKHTHTTKEQVTHFSWAQVVEWLKKARAFMSGYAADIKLFVMTNKEVRHIRQTCLQILLLFIRFCCYSSGQSWIVLCAVFACLCNSCA